MKKCQLYNASDFEIYSFAAFSIIYKGILKLLVRQYK